METYPDLDDNITNALISRSPYPGYWEKSEICAFSFFDRYLKRRDPGLLLDLGCGQGRLLIKYKKYFKRAIALESDLSRLKEAKATLNANHIDNVEFIGIPFLNADLASNTFDVIICSHVIQHIPSGDCPAFLAKLRDILKPGGMIALSTNHSPRNSDFFVKDTLIGGKIKEMEISEMEFNKLAIGHKQILPIHFFSQETLRCGLAELNIVDVKVFHFLQPRNCIDAIAFRDKIYQKLPNIADTGRDIMITLLKA